MTNTSSILPKTFHVFMPWESFLASEPYNSITDWMQENNGARVDVFAYEADDVLDHHHFFSLLDQNDLYMAHLWDEKSVISWAIEVLANSDELPKWLLCFHDAKDAVKFKLTFGGAA